MGRAGGGGSFPELLHLFFLLVWPELWHQDPYNGNSMAIAKEGAAADPGWARGLLEVWGAHWQGLFL